MRHIAIFGDDLEALNCLCIADDIVKENGAVLLNPGRKGQLRIPQVRSSILTKEAHSLKEHQQ